MNTFTKLRNPEQVRSGPEDLPSFISCHIAPEPWASALINFCVPALSELSFPFSHFSSPLPGYLLDISFRSGFSHLFV